MTEDERKRELTEYIEARVNICPGFFRVTAAFAIVTLPPVFHWPDFFEAMEDSGWSFVMNNGITAMFRKS